MQIIMNRPRIILLLLFLFSFVFFATPGESFSVGISTETINGRYTLGCSRPPFTLIPFSILLGIFIYAARADTPGNKNKEVLSLKRRFLSFLIDFAVNILVAGVPITLIALLLNWYQSTEFNWVVFRPYNHSTDTIYFVLFVIQGLGVLVLFGYPISRKKQSVGGIITSTFIEPSTNISLLKASLRSLLGLLTLAAGAISIPWALASAGKRMWHDLIFGTFPIKIIEKDS
jgi:uncharacterized RDD family membrane protein YckC